MPTLLTAGDATNGVVLTSSNDNALTIQTGAAGAKVNAAAFASDGTLTLVKPMAGGSLTLGTAQNTTSGTSIDFTGIPSWVKKITVTFDGVSTSGTSNPLLQLGDSGGIENTGYVGSSALLQNGSSCSAASFTTGFGFLASLATNNLSGSVVISLMDSATNKWAASGNLAATTTLFNVSTAGVKSLSAVLDRIRLTTVGGTDTFDAGSVNILYEG